MKLEIWFDVEQWTKPGNVVFYRDPHNLPPKSDTAVRYKCVVEVEPHSECVPDVTVEPTTIEKDPVPEEADDAG